MHFDAAPAAAMKMLRLRLLTLFFFIGFVSSTENDAAP
jgi:hypothetical protein